MQIPTAYAIIVALVALLTPLFTFLWFVGSFVGLAYLGRNLVTGSTTDTDDEDVNRDSRLAQELDPQSSIFTSTDVFALLGAIVTTGLLSPPSSSSPTLSSVTTSLDDTMPLSTLGIVLLVALGFVGLSSSMSSSSLTTVTREKWDDDTNGTKDDDNNNNDNDKSPDQQLLDLWDEQFDNEKRKRNKR